MVGFWKVLEATHSLVGTATCIAAGMQESVTAKPCVARKEQCQYINKEYDVEGLC